MRRIPLVLLLLLVAATIFSSEPQSAPGSGEPHYVLKDVTLYRSADSLRPVTRLPFRTTVFRMGQDGAWQRVRTAAGEEGFVYGAVLSNTWVRVSKRERLLHLYQGGTLVSTYPAEFGYNPVSDKEQRGSTANRDHWRTPEGNFFVVGRNPNSQYYRAFVLNYPTAEDARRGLARGLISKREHDAIVEAESRFQRPPMNTALGGMIEIHGHGKGAGVNWTQGCVALRDADIDALWSYLQMGTPVVIES